MEMMDGMRSCSWSEYSESRLKCEFNRCQLYLLYCDSNDISSDEVLILMMLFLTFSFTQRLIMMIL